MVNLDETLVSREAANFLKISLQKLNRLRNAGIISGSPLGAGGAKVVLFAYKVTDLRAIDPAILKDQKRGRKKSTT